MTIKAAKPFDPTHDYTKDISQGDIKTEDGRDFVFLRGLEALARQRGVVSAKCVRMEPMAMTSEEKTYTYGFYCTYEYSFVDGGSYQGSAYATIKNCDGNFRLYLTAMAESRAKARALRTSFGIGLCSVEEKSDASYKTDSDLGPIDDAQLVLIRKLATQHNFDKAQVLELLDIPRQVNKMEELTKQEGTELSCKLNAARPKRGKGAK